MRILKTKRFEKDLEKVPDFIRVKVMVWVGMVETLGLLEIRKRPGFHDEPLKGKRMGERSVRLNRAYRMIYRELSGYLQIVLLEVTKHDY